ncbi:hypothetical protein GCM10027168_11550 [Streptomyces capparidis]
MAVLCALGAALCYGTSDFAGGLAARRNRPAPVLLAAQGVAALLLAACLPAAAGQPRTSHLVTGAAAGLCTAAGNLCLYAALARGPMTTAAPLTAVLVAALPLAHGLATGEHLDPTAWLGAPLALLAIALISRTGGTTGTPSPHRSTLTYATASGLGRPGRGRRLRRTPPGALLNPSTVAGR